eukprot:scaffold22549_cov52-Phaeocystis_antarctica.AAC.4
MRASPNPPRRTAPCPARKSLGTRQPSMPTGSGWRGRGRGGTRPQSGGPGGCQWHPSPTCVARTPACRSGCGARSAPAVAAECVHDRDVEVVQLHERAAGVDEPLDLIDAEPSTLLRLLRHRLRVRVRDRARIRVRGGPAGGELSLRHLRQRVGVQKPVASAQPGRLLHREVLGAHGMQAKHPFEERRPSGRLDVHEDDPLV